MQSVIVTGMPTVSGAALEPNLNLKTLEYGPCAKMSHQLANENRNRINGLSPGLLGASTACLTRERHWLYSSRAVWRLFLPLFFP